MKNKTAFISGHGDITNEEFSTHYIPVLAKAIEDGIKHFVVGDFRGVDARAQTYLYNYIVYHNPESINVTVYHMFNSPRHNLGQFATIGGFSDDESRDAAMTEASYMDIAWVRPGKEKSGTALNLKRRNR